MDGLSYKKIAVIAGLVILVVCGCLVYLRDHVLVENRDIPELTDISAAYQAKEEIATAKSNPLDQTLRFTLGFDMDGLKDLFKR